MTNMMVPTLAEVTEMLGGDVPSDPIEAKEAAKTAMAAAMAAIAAKNGGTSRPFLTFDTKSGMVTYKNGDKRAALDGDAELALNILGVKQVLSCWKDGKVVDKVEVPFHEELPDIATLPMHGIDEEACAADDECRDGWSESMILPVTDLETGKEFDFLAPNMTTRNAFGRLMGDLSAELAMYDPTEEAPVFTISHTTYKSKHGGHTVYAPKFNVERWQNIVEEEDTKKALPSKKGKK